MHPSEKQFAGLLTSRGKTWKAQPCRFKLGHTTYTPDFYCLEDDVYYEVKKTCSSKEIRKIIRFKKTYPKIILKVISPNGYPYYCPGSDSYLSALENIMAILLSKDITEISDKERAILNQSAPSMHGIRRPSFSHSLSLAKTIKAARRRPCKPLATDERTSGRRRQK